MARSRACIKLPQLESNGEHGWNKREQERQETCVQILHAQLRSLLPLSNSRFSIYSQGVKAYLGVLAVNDGWARQELTDAQK